MRSFIKRVLLNLPKPIYNYLLELGRLWQDKVYFKQGFTLIKCGKYELRAPKNHALTGLLKTQPYRDLFVGVTAKFISEKYPNCTIVDIGANIGDTAALIATQSRNKLILIEASEYFYEILIYNVRQFPNECVVRKLMISNGKNILGSMHHRGGTAYFHEGFGGKTEIKTSRLHEVVDKNTRFVKIDTDGYDISILNDSFEWLAEGHPAILFENDIRDIKDLTAVDELFDNLKKIGYEYFVVWDDPGFHVVSTQDLGIIKDLNRYLFKLHQSEFQRGISNYDVLCLHREEIDIYNKVCGCYKTY